MMAMGGLIVLPPDPGRKSAHLALITHRGGGWYEICCFGTAKRCREGTCKHTAGLAMKTTRSVRPLRQVVA